MRKILTAIDFSDSADEVLRVAREELKLLGGEMLLVHVEAPQPDFVGYEPGPQSVRDSVAGEIREDHRRLIALEKQLQEEGLKVSARLLQGPTAGKIAEEARRCGADLLILGTHGHGAMYHLLLGSVSESVLRQTPCPVLLVPSPKK